MSSVWYRTLFLWKLANMPKQWAIAAWPSMILLYHVYNEADGIYELSNGGSPWFLREQIVA